MPSRERAATAADFARAAAGRLGAGLSGAFALIRIHPYELSYYNELVGGPAGRGSEGSS